MKYFINKFQCNDETFINLLFDENDKTYILEHRTKNDRKIETIKESNKAKIFDMILFKVRGEQKSP